jgi:nickel/cobalt exporter
MEFNFLTSILALGFGLGLLHALDADHIMAISSMAAVNTGDRKPWSVSVTLKFCMRWAIGHGSILLALTTLFIFARFELPEFIPQLAEKIIGMLLIILGAWIIISLRQSRLRLETHSHEQITHAHLVSTGKIHQSHTPVLVGVTHGFAGSAPILAIIPALESDNAWVGLGYVALFSLGVLTAMLVFGVFLGRLQNWIAGWGQGLFLFSRMVVAFTSIAFGGYWLFSAG